MKVKTFIQYAGGLILILIFLTACGGGIETNFSVDSNGVDFQTSEPKFVAEETITIELPLANQTRLWLEAVNGEIEIEGRHDANSLSVTAQKRVESDSLADAEAHLDELEIFVADQIDEFFIQTLQPGSTKDRKYVVDYYFTLPINLEIMLNLTNGDITVQDVENSVLVDAVNGDVFLSNIFGSTVVDLVNGSIDSKITLPLNGEVRLSIGNGNIDLSIPTSTSAILTASVTNGSISTSSLEFDDVEQFPHSLTGTLGNGEGTIELDTVNGNISVVGFD